MEIPVLFEEEYPEESEVLKTIYKNEPKYNCPRGHKHYFNLMNCKVNRTVQVIPLRNCSN